MAKADREDPEILGENWYICYGYESVDPASGVQSHVQLSLLSWFSPSSLHRHQSLQLPFRISKLNMEHPCTELREHMKTAYS